MLSPYALSRILDYGHQASPAVRTAFLKFQSVIYTWFNLAPGTYLLLAAQIFTAKRPFFWIRRDACKCNAQTHRGCGKPMALSRAFIAHSPISSESHFAD
jgi:hypothetical protein